MFHLNGHIFLKLPCQKKVADLISRVQKTQWLKAKGPMTPPLGEHNNLSIDTTRILDVREIFLRFKREWNQWFCLFRSSHHWFMLTLKSMPTVEMKLPARNAPSLKRTSRHVFPTPESPTSITCTKQERKKPAKLRGFQRKSQKWKKICFLSPNWTCFPARMLFFNQCCSEVVGLMWLQWSG